MDKKAFCMPYDIYHSSVTDILKIAGDFIAQNNNWTLSEIKEKDGRKASSIFETNFIKDFMFGLEYSKLLENHIHNNTSGTLQFLSFVDTTLDNSNGNSASREWADIGINFLYDNNEVFVPVNIKYTAGTTADNVCGWKAFAFLLFEDYENHSIEKSIWESISQGQANWDITRDYFIWSFKHGSKTGKLFSEHSSFSLLGVSPNSLTFNNSQSFPVQAKPFGLSFDANSDIPISERKRRLAKWIATNRKKKAEELYLRLNNSLAFLDRQ